MKLLTKPPLSLFLLIAMMKVSITGADAAYQPSPENLENREWFQNAKFGLFVHWGVYATLADGEWVMNQQKLSVDQYERLPEFFNPTQFDPKEWVAMVKGAGMKYITITAKHHDGFAMYDSAASDYDIVDRTPYGKDVLKALKKECDEQGIKLFFYYSQLDWHHTDYFPRGQTGQHSGRPDGGSWNSYIDYMNAQLTELLSNYGEIGGIWFDGMWDREDANWRLEETYNLIHKLQPGAMIGSNHHLNPFDGEDLQTFERDLPGQHNMGFNRESTQVSNLPLEMCETMNGSWGYNLRDTRYKSTQTLIQTMVRAAGYGANFLLNTGPMANGRIQKENMETLAEIGSWLEQNGESIYGTRRGPIPPRTWGATTSKGNVVYLHALEIENERILIPNLDKKLVSVVYLQNGKKVDYAETELGVIIFIPEANQDPIDTILKLEYQ